MTDPTLVVGVLDPRQVPLIAERVIDADGDPRPIGGREQLVRLRGRSGQRLLDEDVDPGVGGAFDGLSVEDGRQRHDRRIDRLRIQECLVVRVGSGNAGAFGPLAVLRQRVGGREDLDARHRKGRLQVNRADVSDTEHAERERARIGPPVEKSSWHLPENGPAACFVIVAVQNGPPL
ncbi:hypothetical protein [Halosolutus gelatinilyticus]|uniref:hypothetical protein n=1 Tax=Halosolutus gelatinilyticus TaxID=2931975 RepID=UPI001FF3D728|nr:hypothetical protein [Halosolutus gelatinilyticus]